MIINNVNNNNKQTDRTEWSSVTQAYRDPKIRKKNLDMKIII